MLPAGGIPLPPCMEHCWCNHVEKYQHSSINHTPCHMHMSMGLVFEDHKRHVTLEIAHYAVGILCICKIDVAMAM